jgi:hypothetical protein
VNNRVANEKVAPITLGHPNADASAKAVARVPVNHGIFYPDVVRGQDVDAVNARGSAVNVERTQANRLANIPRVSDVNIDSINERVENRPVTGAVCSIDIDGFSDRYCAEAARIKRADLTIFRGLRNSARIRFARSGAAARIYIVTDARYPGASRLRIRNRRKRNRTNGKHKNVYNLLHNDLLWTVKEID